MALLSDLVVPATKDEIRQRILDICEAAGLPVTAWQPGSFPLTVVEFCAEVFADLFLAVAQIANGAILELCSGGWLILRGRSQYQEDPKPSTFTVGTVRLDDHGGGPHTITIGAVLVATPGGLRYRNTSGGTLPLNGSLDVTFSAEATGAKYNVSVGEISVLVTSLPTVSVSNPSIGTSGTWVTTLGTDAESGEAFKQRLSAKWGTLSTGSPISAYEFKALSLLGVTRCRVDDGNPDGPGTTRVYIDSAAAVSALQAILDAFVPASSKSTAMAATSQTVTIPGTIYVATASRAAAETAVSANLTELALRIQIGGIVRKADVYEAITSALPDDNKSDFVLGSTWAGAPDNIQLLASAIPSFVDALEWVEV